MIYENIILKLYYYFLNILLNNRLLINYFKNILKRINF